MDSMGDTPKEGDDWGGDVVGAEAEARDTETVLAEAEEAPLLVEGT